MTDFSFQLLVAFAILCTVGSIVADALGSKTLPADLQRAKAAMAARVIAACKDHPLLGFLRLSLVVSYMLSLAALAFFVPFSPWLCLSCSIAWSALSFSDAPHVLPRPVVPFYEASLLLNGAVLALVFWSPLSSRFG